MIPRLAPLEAHGVRLEPFEASHIPAVLAAARDQTLWTWWPRDMRTEQTRADTFDWLLAEQAAGRWRVWCVVGADGAVLGQSCYLALRPEHRGLEIGGTWYVRAAQGGLVNPVAKRLLLGRAFAHGIERVEIKTDALNAHSRRAIEKLGATFEGVFRRHLLMPDGRWRDTAWYSVLREEWPAIEVRLAARIDALRRDQAGSEPDAPARS
jgi:RimJ/RimL family protein N-acetyltransferase